MSQHGPHRLPAGPHVSVMGFGAQAGPRVPIATHQEDSRAGAHACGCLCMQTAGRSGCQLKHGKGRGLKGGGVSGATPGDSGGACCWDAFRAHRPPTPTPPHLPPPSHIPASPFPPHPSPDWTVCLGFPGSRQPKSSNSTA